MALWRLPRPDFHRLVDTDFQDTPLTLRPACSPSHLCDPLHRRLRRFRFLHRRSDCFRVERTQFPGGTFTRSRPAPFHGARAMGCLPELRPRRKSRARCRCSQGRRGSDAVGTSKESFAKDVEDAVAEASKTVRGIKWAPSGILRPTEI